MERLAISMRKIRALIVDGEMTTRLALRQILEEEGCIVLEAADDTQAVTMFEGEHPHIILLECTMPAMDGFTTCVKIRASPQGERVPILMITAPADGASIIKGYQSGVTDFITKPLQVEMLRHRVHSALHTKILEENLVRGKKEWEAAFDAVSDLILLTDREGKIIRCNQAVVQHLRSTYSDILGRNIEELFREDLTLATVRTIAGASQMQCSANGSWFESRMYPARLEGCLYGMVYVIKDITDRKRAEEALLLSEERFQLMTHATNDAVWDLNLSTGERWWNKGLHSVFGHTPDQVVKDQAWWEAQIHPEYRPKVLASLQAALTGEGQFWSKEYRFRRGDGSYAYVFDRGYITQDQDGHPQRVIGAMMDLTERKRVEEALIKSEELFSKAFHASPTPMTITGIENGVLIDVNDSWERLFGYDRRTIIGCEIMNLDIYDNPDDRVAIMQQVNEQGKIDGYPLKVKTQSGEERSLLMSVQLVEIQGQNCLLSTLYDITELQRLHEAILAAQKLADLGTLAAGVAHEINSPLQVITGISDSLTLRLDQALKDPESLQRRLDTIKRNAWRCTEIVRALLTYSRSSLPQAGAYDLNAVIRDSLLLIEHQLRSWSNITIVTDLADELPLIACDRNQITQVLINLLSNARDAMLMGGDVTIRTYCQAGADEVCLSVSDNGIGISKDAQSRIFDPFYTTKPLGKGTGLGLSIVNGIVRSHHGTIELQSEPGRGTTFILRFPTAASDSKVVPTPLNLSNSPFNDSIGSWPTPVGARPWW